MQTSPLADFATSLRNASRASKAEVRVPYSRLKRAVADVLLEEGYVEGVEMLSEGKDGKKKPQLRVLLKGSGKKQAITQISMGSKPGCRVYVECEKIPLVLGGLGVNILSTSQGVMSDREARKKRVGGELLLKVY